MKKFRFPLDRVLEWRRVRLRLEEAALQKLHSEVRASAERAHELSAEIERVGRDAVAARSSTAVELQSLDSFRAAVRGELVRLEADQQRRRRGVEAQAGIVGERRREVRMIEKVRERRFAAWEVEATREMDREASELHLARLRASGLDGARNPTTPAGKLAAG